MAKKSKNVRRISNKKRGRPRVRFNFMVIIIIFALTFLGIFGLYMLRANLEGDFVPDESKDTSSVTTTASPAVTIQPSEAQSQPAQPNEPIYPVPESQAADISYFENCCMITDSTLLEMSKQNGFMEVLGNDRLNALNCGNTAISSSYGTMPAYEIMKIKKPMNVYIMLGSDLGVSSTDEMIAAYSNLVTNLHNAQPDTKIYIMQLPPVTASDVTLSNDTINDYNSRLMDMAKKIGVYCIDTNTALKKSDGTLADEYWSAENGTLTDAAYKAISGYILTHTA